MMAGGDSTAADGTAATPSADAGGPKVVLYGEQRPQQGKGTAGYGGGGVVVIEMGASDGGEKVCRICHLSPGGGEGEEGAELILLGCACKDDLGTAHRTCAEAWFRVRGNRCCEICSVNVKNITGEEDGHFMVEWHEGRTPSGSNNTNSSDRVGCWRSQPFCNFLMACLVIAFILPWFFRVSMF